MNSQGVVYLVGSGHYRLWRSAGRKGCSVMPEDDRTQKLAKSLREFQEAAGRASPAATASYSLIGSILLLGGLGYGLDAWRGTGPYGLLGGLLLGVFAGLAIVARSVRR
jgi:F0F1-type ATP synthase assembly protein I